MSKDETTGRIKEAAGDLSGDKDSSVKGRPSRPKERSRTQSTPRPTSEGRCKPGLADAPRLWAGEGAYLGPLHNNRLRPDLVTATAGLAASMFKPKSLAMVEFGSTVARPGASCSRSCCRCFSRSC